MDDEDRSLTAVSAHYDPAYFEQQRASGQFGGWANMKKYRPLVQQSDRVLDFGCGGGFLLSNLDCAGRYGIEPNPAARAMASENGVQVFASTPAALAELGPGSIDLIISNNALEHALEPYRELVSLRPLLRSLGRLHVIAPCESIRWKYSAADSNQHVYSWSPQSLGNLVQAAGYEVQFCRPYIHKWPPRVARYIALLGRPTFDVAARVWGHIDRRWFQVEVLARAPSAEGD